MTIKSELLNIIEEVKAMKRLILVFHIMDQKESIREETADLLNNFDIHNGAS